MLCRGIIFFVASSSLTFPPSRSHPTRTVSSHSSSIPLMAPGDDTARTSAAAILFQRSPSTNVHVDVENLKDVIQDDFRSRVLNHREARQDLIAQQRAEIAEERKKRLAAWVKKQDEELKRAVNPKVRVAMLLQESRRRDEGRYAKLLDALKNHPALNAVQRHRAASRASYCNIALDVVQRIQNAGEMTPAEAFAFGTEGIQCFASMLPWSHSIVCGDLSATILPTGGGQGSAPTEVKGLCHFRHKSEELSERRARAVEHFNTEHKRAKSRKMRTGYRADEAAHTYKMMQLRGI